MANGFRGGDPGLGGDYYFVAWTDVQCPQDQFDRFGAVGAADTVLGSGECRECGFEFLDERVAVVANELAGGQNRLDSRVDLRQDWSVLIEQVIVGNFHLPKLATGWNERITSVWLV
jgi:hypothetical protein